ncbi:hypothetical protein HHI36_000626 [Cryptolaemus montrouzieri]|uniref:Uncharacterized protein n=1 Tax=Cryptolaemus montrouzieri TaxID=559131 RepID=A0ABD2P5G5_9CUCU
MEQIDFLIRRRDFTRFRIYRNSYGRRNKMTKKNNDSEFVDNTDEYTDKNIDENIEEQPYGNRDMILNEEVTMREENIVEESVEHINEETNANIDVNVDEQHFGNQKIILNECTGIFDIVEDSSSSQDENMDETMPTKYNKKNNQRDYSEKYTK